MTDDFSLFIFWEIIERRKVHTCHRITTQTYCRFQNDRYISLFRFPWPCTISPTITFLQLSPSFSFKLRHLPLLHRDPRSTLGLPLFHSILPHSMASLQSLQLRYSFFPFSPKTPHSRSPRFSRIFPAYVPRKVRIFSFRGDRFARNEVYAIRCSSKAGSEVENVSIQKDYDERPPFDINLAVILAGFAFEAYTSPPVCLSAAHRYFYYCFCIVIEKLKIV